MSAAVPFVRVYATERARVDAARLMPGVVLENAVADAIGRGRKRRFDLPGLPPLASDEQVVFVGGGSHVARVRKHAAPLTGGPAWLAVRVDVAPPPRNPHRQGGSA